MHSAIPFHLFLCARYGKFLSIISPVVQERALTHHFSALAFVLLTFSSGATESKERAITSPMAAEIQL